MSESTPSLPQPELEPKGITSEQYLHFTPEKLELWKGYLGYGGQDPTGFQLAVLRNMGLRAALGHTKASLWVEALKEHLHSALLQKNSDPDVREAMVNSLNRGLEDLVRVVEYLEQEGQ